MYSIKALQQHSPGILTILIILLASPLAAEPGVLWRTYHFSPPEYFVLRNQPADTSFEELGTTAEEIDKTIEVVASAAAGLRG